MVSARYRQSLLFPLLDTFPGIYATLGKNLEGVTVDSSLSTTPEVGAWVKALRQVVLNAVGREEREALSNGLGEIAEGYEEGWDGVSDDDSDD